ncbi:hypothetical protein OH77DRAFT_251005 [Trametes cingulata]|nr:hypothetical protein OH77DRAFT_251005 [Trametes cingulata]
MSRVSRRHVHPQTAVRQMVAIRTCKNEADLQNTRPHSVIAQKGNWSSPCPSNSRVKLYLLLATRASQALLLGVVPVTGRFNIRRSSASLFKCKSSSLFVRGLVSRRRKGFLMWLRPAIVSAGNCRGNLLNDTWSTVHRRTKFALYGHRSQTPQPCARSVLPV